MTREQVKLFITKTPTHYRDLNPDLWFLRLDLRPLDQPAVVDFEFLAEIDMNLTLSSQFIFMNV
jgi:hypothetical protein